MNESNPNIDSIDYDKETRTLYGLESIMSYKPRIKVTLTISSKDYTTISQNIEIIVGNSKRSIEENNYETKGGMIPYVNKRKRRTINNKTLKLH
jgi:hypothetical protein